MHGIRYEYHSQQTAKIIIVFRNVVPYIIGTNFDTIMYIKWLKQYLNFILQ